MSYKVCVCMFLFISHQTYGSVCPQDIVLIVLIFMNRPHCLVLHVTLMCLSRRVSACDT